MSSSNCRKHIKAVFRTIGEKLPLSFSVFAFLLVCFLESVCCMFVCWLVFAVFTGSTFVYLHSFSRVCQALSVPLQSSSLNKDEGSIFFFKSENSNVFFTKKSLSLNTTSDSFILERETLVE